MNLTARLSTLFQRPAVAWRFQFATHIIQNPADGWYKLLTAEEGDFYNVPVPEEGTDLVQLKSQMRVSWRSSSWRCFGGVRN